jgi:hypothetical protein
MWTKMEYLMRMTTVLPYATQTNWMLMVMVLEMFVILFLVVVDVVNLIVKSLVEVEDAVARR